MTHLELSSDDFFRKCRDITDRDFLALSRSVAAYVSTVGGSTDSHLSIASVDLCLRSVYAQFPDKAKLNDSTQQLSAFKREPFEYVSSEIKKVITTPSRWRAKKLAGKQTAIRWKS